VAVAAVRLGRQAGPRSSLCPALRTVASSCGTCVPRTVHAASRRLPSTVQKYAFCQSWATNSSLGRRTLQSSTGISDSANVWIRCAGTRVRSLRLRQRANRARLSLACAYTPLRRVGCRALVYLALLRSSEPGLFAWHLPLLLNESLAK
jgi:hypothetical protein